MNLSALRSRDFRLYLFGNVFGLNANWILRLLSGWLAWDLTGSPFFVGLVSFLNFSPVLIAGPIFGVLVDRSDVKKAALWIQTILVSLSLTLLAILSAGILSPIILAIFATVLGFVLAAYQPVRLSLGPRLVEKAQVSSVVSLGATNFNLSRLTGPAIGGVMIAAFGEVATVGLVVALQFPFIFMLTQLSPRQNMVVATQTTFLNSFGEGLCHIRRHRPIWTAFVFVAVFSIVIRGLLETLPILADGVYARGPAGLGALTASVGAGALFASIFQLILPSDSGSVIPKRGTISALIGAILFTVVGYINHWTLTLICLGGIGFASSMVGISFQTSVQMQLEDGMRGRVMSLWMTLAVGGTAIGALILGGLAQIAGLPKTIALIGPLSILVFIGLIMRFSN